MGRLRREGREGLTGGQRVNCSPHCPGVGGVVFCRAERGEWKVGDPGHELGSLGLAAMSLDLVSPQWAGNPPGLVQEMLLTKEGRGEQEGRGQGSFVLLENSPQALPQPRITESGVHIWGQPRTPTSLPRTPSSLCEAAALSLPPTHHRSHTAT